MNEFDTTDRVSDAPTGNWVYRVLPRGCWPYAQLARWDRPIGWWLLLWPCWWSVALAALAVEHGGEGSQLSETFVEYLLNLLFFMFGAIAMRGAGCTYNDLVDAELDAKVTRTASRPIPSGRVSKNAAKLFLLVQSLVGLAMLVFLCWLGGENFNAFAFWLGIASLLVVALYPFAKRVTDWPQFVLGLAFSWGALMGWAVVFSSLSAAPVLLYLGCILWTIGYDTIYAHQDREDDALVGVRSTARLFDKKTKPALLLFYSATLLLFALAFWLAQTGLISYIGLLLGCGQMLWQIHTLDIDDAENCLKLFKSNSWFGWIVFIGLLIDLSFYLD